MTAKWQAAVSSVVNLIEVHRPQEKHGGSALKHHFIYSDRR